MCLLRGSAFLPILLAGLTPFAVLVLIITATAFGPIAWRPPILWIDTFGTHSNFNSAETIASDSSGLYVQSYVNYSTFGLPGGSVFLSKYSFDGGSIWMRSIGNSSEIIDGISVTSDATYLTGENFNGGVVQKYDKTGSQIWVEQFGTGASSGSGISATSAGVYVGGTLLANQTAKGVVIFVREYNFVGNVVWTEDLTNASGLVNGGLVKGIYAASSGVYVVGSVFGTLLGSTRTGDNDAFLVKYDLNGNFAWVRQFGTPNLDTAAYSVSGDTSGVYLSGTSTSSTLGFLRKYDFSGNLAWADQIDSPDSSGVGESSLAVDSSAIYVSMGTPGDREFILKYDLNGGKLWSSQMQYSGSLHGSVRGYRLATGTGGLYVAGSLPDGSAGLVAEVSPSPSLVFFGINPPLSFVLIVALVAVAATSLFFFRRLRRQRIRPTQAGPPDRSLPVKD
jgi:hypothetical protein